MLKFKLNASSRIVASLMLISTELFFSAQLLAAEVLQFELVIKDHLFSPSTLYLPAGQKIKLVIHNQDAVPEEFESFSLNREKVIVAHGKGVVFLGPLSAGQHEFIGEYHPDSARGLIVVLSAEAWQQRSTTDAH